MGGIFGNAKNYVDRSSMNIKPIDTGSLFSDFTKKEVGTFPGITDKHTGFNDRVKFPNTGGKGMFSGIDPIMKFDLALAGVDLLGTIAMGLQSQLAKKPVVNRTAVPRMNTPVLNDNMAAEESMVKENLGTQTNTLLNYSMEHGRDIGEQTGIFANANRVMRESAADISGKKRDISNQQSLITAETEAKNQMLSYENEREFQARKADTLSKDSLMRGQQLSMAVGNIGQIGSRLMNDFMLTDLIKKGNEQDSLYAKLAMFKPG